jgi:hypothetical protein
MKKQKLGSIPAFPAEVGYGLEGNRMESFQLNSRIDKFSGMSKRYLTAKDILCAIVSNQELRKDLLMDHRQPSLNPENINPSAYMVEYAYGLADELLKQENQ